jgi:excisionase family DNA binding protein
MPAAERLFTVAQAADLLATSDSFPRRLIAERRIRFVRVGRHVRIPSAYLSRHFVSSSLPGPLSRLRPGAHRRRRKVA